VRIYSGWREKRQRSVSGDPMLSFHEGLPRSGKSYEAMVKHIIPALKKGRIVYTNMAGLDSEKIAVCSGLTVDEVKILLRAVSDEQIENLGEFVENNALVVIDELQNHFPMARESLPRSMMKFVSEHGHRGIDLLGMGQDHKDVHALWKRRIDRKLVFIKKDVLGKPDHYHWKLEKQVAGKFVRVNSGSSKYDPQYFGTYASFEEGAIDDDAQGADKRASLFQSWGFKVGVPLAGLAGVAGLGFAIWAFNGGLVPKVPATAAKAIKGPAVAPVVAIAPGAKPDIIKAVVAPAAPKNYIEEISEKWRPRLGGVMELRGVRVVLVEWYDEGLRVRERLNTAQLQGFGYETYFDAGGVTLGGKDRKPMRLTSWPIDPVGMVSRETRMAIGEMGTGPRVNPVYVIPDVTRDALKLSPSPASGAEGGGPSSNPKLNPAVRPQ
jgi:zona occludens toxin